MSEVDREGYWQRMAGQRIERRRALRFAALGSAGLATLALACGSKGGPSGQASSQPTSTNTGNAVGGGQAKTGGHLRHILPYSAGNIDPHTTEDYVGYGFVEG
ncbi:MAG TPA: hypothetical protein VK821_15370, partial [Dehalococcoidia bacterium]|nr:hypothetical protein [Dehalococcoidia bacterium]